MKHVHANDLAATTLIIQHVLEGITADGTHGRSIDADRLRSIVGDLRYAADRAAEILAALAQ